jgi:5-methyltetrahydrofolate--homocysteine methyltransferase
VGIETTLQGTGKAITISPGGRTYIIGERVNPTGKKRLARALAEKDWGYLQNEAIRQVSAGADMIDVNVGAAGLDEVELLPEAVRVISEVVSVPLSIDSRNPRALAAALEICPGRPLVNSISGESKDIRDLLPIVADRGAAMIAFCMDDNGIPRDAPTRISVAHAIVEAAAARDIALHDVIVDPLVMTVGADDQAGATALETIRLIVAELGVNVTGGASNVSFGLPNRTRVGAAFLALAIASGLNCPITDPLDDDLHYSLLATDLLRGKDGYAQSYLRHYRKRSKELAQA